MRVGGARRLGNRVIVKPLGIEGAGQFRHLGGLLADLRHRKRTRLERNLIGEAGIPAIKLALGVARAGSAEMVDHRLLIADDRVFVARPKLTVNRVFASRADHHEIGLEQYRLLRLDISRRITLLVGSRGALKRRGGEQRRNQDNLPHRIPPSQINVRDNAAAYPAIDYFQEQPHSLSGLGAANWKKKLKSSWPSALLSPNR